MGVISQTIERGMDRNQRNIQMMSQMGKNLMDDKRARRQQDIYDKHATEAERLRDEEIAANNAPKYVDPNKVRSAAFKAMGDATKFTDGYMAGATSLKNNVAKAQKRLEAAQHALEIERRNLYKDHNITSEEDLTKSDNRLAVTAINEGLRRFNEEVAKARTAIKDTTNAYSDYMYRLTDPRQFSTILQSAYGTQEMLDTFRKAGDNMPRNQRLEYLARIEAAREATRQAQEEEYHTLHGGNGGSPQKDVVNVAMSAYTGSAADNEADLAGVGSEEERSLVKSFGSSLASFKDYISVKMSEGDKAQLGQLMSLWGNSKHTDSDFRTVQAALQNLQGNDVIFQSLKQTAKNENFTPEVWGAISAIMSRALMQKKHVIKNASGGVANGID